MKKNIVSFCLVIFLIASFGFLKPINVYAYNTWTEKAPMPTARPTHSCILSTDNQIYCIGGFYLNDDLEVFDNNEAYNPETNFWSIKAGMPTERDPVLAYQDGLIYALGSKFYAEFTPAVMTTNEAYNPTTDSWEEKEAIPTEGEIFISFAAHSYNEKIYVVGLEVIRGEEDDYSIRVYEYTPSEDSWTEKYNEEILQEEGFLMPTAASKNNKIYLIGGFNPFSGPTVVLNDVLEYDIETNSFEQKTAIPKDGIFAASASYGTDDKIYVFGGASEIGEEEIGSPSTQTHIYDSATNAWEQGTPIPTARLFSAAVFAANEKIYVIGGQVNPPSDTNEEFSSSDQSEQRNEPKTITQLPKTGNNLQNFLNLLLPLSFITPYLVEKIKLKRQKPK